MNIRAQIRAAIAETANPEPAIIARRLARNLTDQQARAALDVALPYLVRDEIRKERHKGLGAADVRGTFAWQPEPVTPLKPGTRKQLREAGLKGAASERVRVNREQRLLDVPISLGTGKWKRLGDCTPADLRTLAAHTRERYAELERRAATYDRLADDMEANGIARVADYDGADQVRAALAA